jgi:hypothetical protein
VPSRFAPHSRPHRGLRLALALCAALVAGCGLADVFGAAGAGAVVFVWGSDSVLTNGQVVPIDVVVLADGELVTEPHLQVTIPDTTNIALVPSGDSVVAKQSGRGDVVVVLRSSLTTGIAPDTVFELRVTGGPL